MPALASLLAQADKTRIPYRSYEDLLWAQFSEAPPVNKDIPAAAIQRQVTFEDAHNFFWIWAEPVHLMVDQTQLLMDDPQSLCINDEESKQIMAELNAAYRQTDFTFFSQGLSQGNRKWYLRARQCPEITTVPLSKVLGRNIDPFLPSGPDHRHWHGLMNEVQMILHASQVNQKREWNGQAKINSVWFWGGGVLPESIDGDCDIIVSNHPLAIAMAKLAGIAHYPLPRVFTKLLDNFSAGERILLIGDRYATTEDYDKAIFKPIVENRRRLREIHVYADNDCKFSIGRRWRWTFWKPQQSVHAYFQS